MKRDVFKFLSGAAAAASLGHVWYVIATARGTISVPVWRGREWGVGKLLIEALFYGAIGVGLGYLGWRREPGVARRTSPLLDRSGGVAEPVEHVAAQR